MSEFRKRALICTIGYQRNEILKSVKYAYSKCYRDTKKNNRVMKPEIRKSGGYTLTSIKCQKSSLPMKNSRYSKAVERMSKPEPRRMALTT